MDDKKFMLFGTDLQRIPCFKKTFQVSLFSGFAAGLGHFLFTSKIKRSTDIAVLSFTVSTIGFWVYCRYNWSKEYEATQQMNRNLHSVMVNQGSKPTNNP